MSLPSRHSNEGRSLIAYLAEKFGTDSKVLIDELAKIALGQATADAPSSIDGLTVVRFPSIAERTAALTTLLAYAHGKPTQAVAMHVSTPRKGRWNPDKLSIEELESFERIARKAQLPDAIEGETVDAEFTPDALPSGEE